MTTVILVIHVLLTIALIAVILLQRSEGGALGIGGGGGGGMSGFMSGRATANVLTRATAILAGLFFLTSIALAILATHRDKPRSIVDQPAGSAPMAPASTAPAGSSDQPAAPAPAAPAATETPAAPKG